MLLYPADPARLLGSPTVVTRGVGATVGAEVEPRVPEVT